MSKRKESWAEYVKRGATNAAGAAKKAAKAVYDAQVAEMEHQNEATEMAKNAAAKKVKEVVQDPKASAKKAARAVASSAQSVALASAKIAGNVAAKGAGYVAEKVITKDSKFECLSPKLESMYPAAEDQKERIQFLQKKGAIWMGLLISDVAARAGVTSGNAAKAGAAVGAIAGGLTGAAAGYLAGGAIGAAASYAQWGMFLQSTTGYVDGWKDTLKKNNVDLSKIPGSEFMKGFSERVSKVSDDAVAKIYGTRLGDTLLEIGVAMEKLEPAISSYMGATSTVDLVKQFAPGTLSSIIGAPSSFAAGGALISGLSDAMTIKKALDANRKKPAESRENPGTKEFGRELSTKLFFPRMLRYTMLGLGIAAVAIGIAFLVASTFGLGAPLLAAAGGLAAGAAVETAAVAVGLSAVVGSLAYPRASKTYMAIKNKFSRNPAQVETQIQQIKGSQELLANAPTVEVKPMDIGKHAKRETERQADRGQKSPEK